MTRILKLIGIGKERNTENAWLLPALVLSVLIITFIISSFYMLAF